MNVRASLLLAAGVFVGGQQPVEHLQIADHDLEQVVEVVRDAAGQLADRLHLLALAQLRLHVVQSFLLRQPFRNIGRELIGTDRRPLGRDQRAEA